MPSLPERIAARATSAGIMLTSAGAAELTRIIAEESAQPLDQPDRDGADGLCFSAPVHEAANG